MPKQRVVRHEVVQPLDQPFRFIPLTQGQNAIVDAADFEWLSQWNWFARWHQDVKKFRAVRNDRRRWLQMAVQILGCKPGEYADHKNRNPLDNRRQNLRKSTAAQSSYNRSLYSSNTTGYRGVRKQCGKWEANISFHERWVYLGRFSRLKDAVKARDEAARKLHGEFAALNFH